MSREHGILAPTGSYRIALVYPNPYRVAMSSLGFQVMYRLFNAHEDVRCERAVLPDDVAEHRRTRKPLLTIEGRAPVGGADCIAISLAYEPDIAGMFEVLDLSSIPVRREDRDETHPPVILGGPITMSNALPLAPFCDAIVIGDGEPVAPALLEALLAERDTSANQPGPAIARERLLDDLAAMPGVFVPARHGDAVPDMLLSGTEALPAVGQIWTPDSELSNMMLVETSRGCPRYCTFCVMRATAQPMREADPKAVERVIDTTDAPRIGFVGAAVSEYTHIRRVLTRAVDGGKGVGISSLRADRLDDEFVALLHAGGYRTMTVASDAPSQAMRGRLKKGLRGRHLRHAAELAARHGLKVYKMYVIVGLPGETMDDIDELADFSLELQKIVPRVALGLSPFVPKLHTPLGDAEFPEIKPLDQRLKHLRRRVANRGVDLRSVSPRWAWVEYRLSQGGPDVGLAAFEAWKAGNRFADYKRAFDALETTERAALDAARRHALWQPANMR